MECRWTYLDGITSLDVSTPLVALDLRLFEHEGQGVAISHRTAHVEWRPAIRWSGLSSVAASLRNAGARGVSVSGITEAASAIAAGMSEIVLSSPPVVARQPERLAELCHEALLSIVCDHFAQAERIATACQDAGSEAGVLLRVDVGRHRLGVRPGPDLSDLAEGVGRLRGIRLDGIWVGGPPLATGVGKLGSDERGRLLDRCRASLTRAGHQVSTVSVSRLDDASGAGSIVTETRTPVPTEERGAVAVVAGVIGRPTRDQAVVDAGRDLLGRSASVAGLPGLTEVTFIGEEFTVLWLAAERQDLAIGDVVALLPETPPRPRSGQEVLLHEQEAWRVERAC